MANPTWEETTGLEPKWEDTSPATVAEALQPPTPRMDQPPPMAGPTSLFSPQSQQGLPEAWRLPEVPISPTSELATSLKAGVPYLPGEWEDPLERLTKPAGKVISQAGRDVADTAKAAALLAGYGLRGVPGGLEEAKQQMVAPPEEKPYEAARAQLPAWQQVVSGVGPGLAEAAPRLAGMAGMTALGVPVPIAGAVAFGLTEEEGLSPKEAAIGALIPGVGKVSGKFAGELATKLGLSEGAALRTIKSVSHMAGPTALLSADAALQISQLPPEQREQAAIDAVAGQIGMLAMAVPGGLKELQKPSARLGEELARVLSKTVENVPEGMPIRAGIFRNAPEQVAPTLQVGTQPTLAEPFLRPEVQQLAGEALGEAGRIVRPWPPPSPQETAAGRLRSAVEGPPPAPEIMPVTTALAERVPGGGEAPYGKVSYRRGAEAPTTERTQEAIAAEKKAAEVKPEVQEKPDVPAPVAEAAPRVTEQNLGTAEPKLLNHKSGIEYGITLQETDLPRIRTQVAKAEENLRAAMKSGDQAAAERAFGENMFYGGVLQAITQGKEGPKGNWERWLADQVAGEMAKPRGVRAALSVMENPRYKAAAEDAAKRFSAVLSGDQFKNLTGGVEVVAGWEKLPDQVRRNILAAYGKDAPFVTAFYDLDSRKVFFNSAHPRILGNPEASAPSLIVHEIMAHRGLRGVMGEEGLRNLSTQVFRTLEQKDINELMEMGYRGGPDLFGEEWLAHAFERVQASGIQSNVLTKIIGMVRQAIRATFKTDLKFSDSEIANLIARGEKGAIKVSEELQKAEAQGRTVPIGRSEFRAMLTPQYQERLTRLIEQGDRNAKLFTDAMNWQKKISSNKLFWKLNEQKSWLEDNSEYWKSVGPDLLCQRSEGTDAAINYLKENLGDNYAPSLGWEIIARAQALGLRTPCPQCYVNSHRTANDWIQKKYVIGVGGYNGQIARRAESMLENLLGRPLRHYSSTDFKAEHIPGLMVEFAEAEAAGVPLAAYSKQGDLARIFGKAGMYVNLSIGMDEFVGMNRAEAYRLRKANPNVATVYVSFTDAETLAALRNPQVDHVIPWHASAQKVTQLKSSLEQLKTKLKVEEIKDYTREQYETTGGEMSERQIKDYEHNGDLKTYLRLVEEAGLTKRFPSLFDQLSEAEKPLYMKLIGREYGKFGDRTPYQPPKANKINQSAIESALENRLATRMASTKEFLDIAKSIEKEVKDGTFVRGGATPEILEGPIVQGKQVFRKTKADLKAEQGRPGAIRAAISRPVPGLEKEYKIFEPGPKPGLQVRTWPSKAVEAIRTSFVTKYRPLNKLAEDIAKAYGRTSTKDIAGIFEQLKGSTGRAEAQVYRFDRDVVPMVKGQEKNFNVYMFLRRTLDRLQQDEADIQAGKKSRREVSDYTIPEAEAKLRVLEQSLSPEQKTNFQQAADLYQRYMDEALQLQLNSGRMSQEAYDAIKSGNQFYAPFFLMKHLELSALPEGSGRRVDTQADYTRAMTGIKDQEFKLGDMLGAARHNIAMSRILADKATAMQEIGKLAASDPNEIYTQRLRFPDQKPKEGWEIVHVYENGTPVRYATRPEIANAVQVFGPRASNWMIKSLQTSGTVFRAGATTFNVPFQASNLMADVPRALLVSKYGIGGPIEHGAAKFGKRFAEDMFLGRVLWDMAHSFYTSFGGNVFKNANKLFLDFLDSGVAGSSVQEYLTPKKLQYKEGTPVSGVSKAAMNLLSVPGDIARAIEQTSKIMGVKRAMRFENVPSGKDLAKQTQQAITELRRYSGSPDFGRQGSVVESARLNLLYMFLNARIQGATADVSRLVGAKGAGGLKQAAVTWARLAPIGIVTAYLYSLNRQPGYKEDYDKRSAQEKNNYWLIPKDSYITNDQGEVIRDYLRIPKREVGKWIANLTESAFRFSEDRDPEGAAKLIQFLIEDISPVNVQGKSLQERVESTASSLNPLIKMPLETSTGREFYRHRDILSSDQMKAASPEEQYNNRTSDVYIKLAQAMPNWAPEVFHSPLMIENMTRNLTAGMITQVLPQKPVRGRSDLENFPLFQRFQASPYTENPEFTKEMDSLKREAADESLNRQREAQKRLDENPNADLSQLLAGTAKNPKLAKQIVDVWLARKNGITSEEKRLMALPSRQRAEYFLPRLDAMTPEQRHAAIIDLAKKRVLTESVFEEMAKIKIGQ